MIQFSGIVINSTLEEMKNPSDKILEAVNAKDEEMLIKSILYINIKKFFDFSFLFNKNKDLCKKHRYI
jgi:hypothetical protein